MATTKPPKKSEKGLEPETKPAGAAKTEPDKGTGAKAARAAKPAKAGTTAEAKAPVAAAKAPAGAKVLAMEPDAAKARLAATGRNDACPCESEKKYKKCHLLLDEQAATPPSEPPDPNERLQAGWRLFEQRRPGAAEKEFRAALELKTDLHDARLGIGLSKLSAGDADGARLALDEVVKSGAELLADLKKQNVKDAFSRKEAQPFLRAAHALGCLAYDKDRHEDALKDLEPVYTLDQGALGTEARLIVGKTLVKLKRASDAVKVLEPAVSSDGGGGRAQMGLALAHFLAGDVKKADDALDRALEKNPHFGKAVLGLIRRHVDSVVGTAPGSREEAVVYAQTYGDVWDESAKKYLDEALNTRAGARSEAAKPATAHETEASAE